MTSQELSAEIANFRRQQIAQRKLWLRWGFASYGIGLALCVLVIVKVAITGEEAPSPMLFVVVGTMFLGLAFIHAGRSSEFCWSRAVNRAPAVCDHQTGSTVICGYILRVYYERMQGWTEWVASGQRISRPIRH
jgi:hypothetical protein